MSLDSEMEEIYKIFFEESHDGLDVMEASLLRLDGNADPETIATIFRAAHSIKGGAATFGFLEVSTFTHGIETLLDEMCNGARPVTADAIQLLLQSVDGLREMVRRVQDRRPVDAARIARLADALARLLARHPGEAVAAPAAPEFLRVGPGWVIDSRPHHDMLRTNNEPLRMFAELERFGALSTTADLGELPALSGLQPDAGYLRWRLELAGAIGKPQIEEVFDWVTPTARSPCSARDDGRDGCGTSRR